MAIMTFYASKWLDSVATEGRSNSVLEIVQAKANATWPTWNILCEFVKRWESEHYDPRPDISREYRLIEVSRWMRIVSAVQDADVEVALADLPESLRRSRKLGDPWYEVLAHVVVELE